MGLDIAAASLILHEHKYRPIKGKILTIGRQSIGIIPRQMDELLRRFDIPRRAGSIYEGDDKTIHSSTTQGRLSQESFFGAFTDAEVLCLDVSDYEKADIICDLQGDVPRELHGTADFIYNGSCLDNIFDPAAAMRNMSRLLKADGRVYHYEQGNSHSAAYLKFSADWFMDFYAINKFADCKTYILDKPNSVGRPMVPNPPGPPVHSFELPQSPHNIVVYHFNPYVDIGSGGYDTSSIEAFTRYEVHCIAEKGPNSTDHRCPIQKHYRTDQEDRLASIRIVGEFLRSPRPIFSNEVPFDKEAQRRIDSSSYPGRVSAVAVMPNHI